MTADIAAAGGDLAETSREVKQAVYNVLAELAGAPWEVRRAIYKALVELGLLSFSVYQNIVAIYN